MRFDQNSLTILSACRLVTPGADARCSTRQLEPSLEGQDGASIDRSWTGIRDFFLLKTTWSWGTIRGVMAVQPVGDRGCLARLLSTRFVSLPMVMKEMAGS